MTEVNYIDKKIYYNYVNTYLLMIYIVFLIWM